VRRWIRAPATWCGLVVCDAVVGCIRYLQAGQELAEVVLPRLEPSLPPHNITTQKGHKCESTQQHPCLEWSPRDAPVRHGRRRGRRCTARRSARGWRAAGWRRRAWPAAAGRGASAATSTAPAGHVVVWCGVVWCVCGVVWCGVVWCVSEQCAEMSSSGRQGDGMAWRCRAGNKSVTWARVR